MVDSSDIGAGAVLTYLLGFLPLVVYPIGLTTYWWYFSWIIFYKFVSFYGIEIKFGTRMHFTAVFLCTKLQGNWIMRLLFMPIFTH